MKDNVHENHRERMRERYLLNGTDGMEPHEVLEMMLYYTIPRSDTNPIAHRLIDTFGSFSGVLDASADDLAKVCGIGSKAAVFLKLFNDVRRVYETDKVKNTTRVTSFDEIGQYLMPRFIGRRNEIVMLMCLDSKNEIICSQILFEGSVNSSTLDIRKLVGIAIRTNATSVVLAHNHPGGLAVPSIKDIQTTQSIMKILNQLKIQLTDHIIYAGNDYISLAQSENLGEEAMELRQEIIAQNPAYYGIT
ncbi:MAG: DNA repair protein RadC [Ruminococcaceae bacterium]|nr:DNA repair protein RadC [Oscillospiraceae bacterium]MBQ2915741.1 DNA repair protein RadC [Clostridia bacterium]